MSQLPLIPGFTPVSADSNEWYTPRRIVEGARRVMGSIDLDPFSCAAAQEIVQAKQFYTKADNGLVLPWLGNMWVNPPYERGFMEQFCQVFEPREDDFASMLLLTNNCTDATWWQWLAERAHQILFLRGRLKFWGPLETGNGAAQGQTIMCFGRPAVARAFTAEFAPMGWIGS